MNTVVTSREDILAATRALAVKGRIADISIRDVAKASGIAVGSVYYYFPSKDDLMAALVEEIWTGILASPARPGLGTNFADVVEDLYARIRRGSSDFPSFFALHAASFADLDKQAGRRIMDKHFAGLKAGLLDALKADEAVDAHVFDATFTREAFVSFVFSCLLSALSSGEKDCAVLLRVLRLTLYRG